jgi:hypothetical protein
MIQTIQSNKPIVLSQNDIDVTYDKWAISKVEANCDFSGKVKLNVFFKLLNIEENNIKELRQFHKILIIDNMMLDSEMSKTTGMFFQKLVEKAFERGIIS